MAIWKDNTANRQAPAPAPEAQDHNRLDLSSRVEAAPAAPLSPAARAQSDRARTESLIASDIMIEGKIEGSGSVRIAGKFKGDVNVQGDLTIESGAKLTGSVRADKVTIAGELEGNVEAASNVNLLATGVVVGDIKAGALTVASGARMRGNTEFGWDETKAAIAKASKAYSNGVETVGNA